MGCFNYMVILGEFDDRRPGGASDLTNYYGFY